MVLPVQNAGTGLTGTYFANGTMAGAPVLRRVDAAMDFNWGKKSPGPGLPEDNFSVRWEGLLAAPSTGSYRFVAKTGDEVRLWINGKKILDTWKGSTGNALTNGSVSLGAGEKTTIKIEFAEGEGDAQFQLLWTPPGSSPQLIPTTSLYPLGSPTTPDPPGSAPAPKPVAAKPMPKPAAPKPAAPAKPIAVAKSEAPAKPAKAPAVTPEQAAAKAAAAAEAKAATAKAKADAAQAKADADAAKATAKAAEAKAKADKAAAKAAAEAEAKAKKDQQPEPLAPGVYVLTSRTTGKPLEVIDPYRPNSQAYQPEAVGAAAGGATLARSTAPQWKIESLGGGFYRLMVPGNNRVLEVLGSSTSNGADLDLWPYYSGNNQAWRIEPTEDGYYKLLAKHSSKALTAKDSANSLEGSIHQWRFSGRENQMWKLQPVQAEEPTPAAMAGSKPGVGAHKMSIYPNPSNGVVQLRYELPEEIPMGWVLYNQNGAPVRVSDYRRQSAGAHHQTLDFTGLPAGDYNLRMTVGTVTTREQLQLRNPKPSVPTPSGN
ncbi:RICIN domain-containing protein [Hymenobacter sp. BT635]|uniref:RICIN domain-containing protein n=1 Tax=Hymenobacter nitidus TaxID=2880929 RepID=A0ABS8AD20_9BACT|nr:PA14 domain-containing protein [Hymenobacter nitidus]MCB2378287.1 RICIN domain-containing protein [Hymenobacter nitidus]